MIGLVCKHPSVFPEKPSSEMQACLEEPLCRMVGYLENTPSKAIGFTWKLDPRNIFMRLFASGVASGKPGIPSSLREGSGRKHQYLDEQICVCTDTKAAHPAVAIGHAGEEAAKLHGPLLDPHCDAAFIRVCVCVYISVYAYIHIVSLV